MKKYLFILQQAPFANSQGLEAMELALALAAFAESVTLLFMRDGVLQLLKSYGSEEIYHKDYTKVFAGLALFDIKYIYVEQAAIKRYGIETNMLGISPAPLTGDQIASLITTHDIVLSF